MQEKLKDYGCRVWRQMPRILGFLILAPVLLIVIYKFAPPPVSTLMLVRLFEGHGISRNWQPLSEISPHLVRAVIAAEDNRYCAHHGVDWEAVGEVLDGADFNERPRGASTISMQTAKNLFLWPGRSYVRKVLEVPLAYTLDVIWRKRRQMEIYLNIAEWGPGIYGAEQAAQHYFGRPAKVLTASQAALLASALANPRVRNPARPGAHHLWLSERIKALVVVMGDQFSCVNKTG